MTAFKISLLLSCVALLTPAASADNHTYPSDDEDAWNGSGTNSSTPTEDNASTVHPFMIRINLNSTKGPRHTTNSSGPDSGMPETHAPTDPPPSVTPSVTPSEHADPPSKTPPVPSCVPSTVPGSSSAADCLFNRKHGTILVMVTAVLVVLCTVLLVSCVALAFQVCHLRASGAGAGSSSGRGRPARSNADLVSSTALWGTAQRNRPASEAELSETSVMMRQLSHTQEEAARAATEGRKDGGEERKDGAEEEKGGKVEKGETVVKGDLGSTGGSGTENSAGGALPGAALTAAANAAPADTPGPASETPDVIVVVGEKVV